MTARRNSADYVGGVPAGERWGVQVMGHSLRVVIGEDVDDPYRADVALVGIASDPGARERGVLLAAAPELRDALRAVEWSLYRDAPMACPTCFGVSPEIATPEQHAINVVGHRDTCPIALALAKADGR